MNGQSEIDCNVVKFEADTFNSAMVTNIGPHPLSQRPTVSTIVVGGLSKRLGIAMHLMAGAMGSGKYFEEDDFREAIRYAQSLIEAEADMVSEEKAISSNANGLGG